MCRKAANMRHIPFLTLTHTLTALMRHILFLTQTHTSIRIYSGHIFALFHWRFKVVLWTKFSASLQFAFNLATNDQRAEGLN